MKLITLGLLASSIASGVAYADNALTTDQLMKATQNSLADYAATQPDMTKSISGFRVTTVGATAQVIIQMNADGMSMSAKYVCAPQADDMACNIQQ